MSLWIWAAIAGAAAQTGRNAAQRGLTSQIGTLGATNVRFLFGLPFAVLFLIAAATWLKTPIPQPTLQVILYTAIGGLAQIGGTALMLLVMRSQGFGITTAWLKSEPVLVAFVGWGLLGDPLTLPMLAAIAIAIAGVLITTLKPGAGADILREARPALLGLLAGFLFGLAAIGFRGGITALPEGGFLIRALTTLTLALAIQSLALGLWLAFRDRAGLAGSFHHWRPSLAAGFLGALASAFWFIAFALTSAANVRTLALVEVPMALIVARIAFGQATTRRENLGIAVLLAGVALLLLAESA